jgi:hypothetical protein
MYGITEEIEGGLPFDATDGKQPISSAYKEPRSDWRSTKWWKGVYRRRTYSHLLQTEGTYIIDER